MELTELQEQVFQRALEKLQHKEWFRGVCTDLFKHDLTDQTIQERGIEACADDVYWDTAYWDGPSVLE